MTPHPPYINLPLITTVLVAAFVALAIFPPADEPAEGRPLALLRYLEPVGAGNTDSTTFTVEEEYSRIGLSYNISEAAHVRASLIAPDGRVHQARAVEVEEGPDRLELEVHEPAQGTWRFTVWTLDDEQRQGYIVEGDFYILGFDGSGRP